MMSVLNAEWINSMDIQKKKTKKREMKKKKKVGWVYSEYFSG